MKSLTYDKNIITGKYATPNVQMLWKLNYCESDAITKDLSDKLFPFFFLSKYACRPYWYFVITIGNRQIEQANQWNQSADAISATCDTAHLAMSQLHS